MSTFDFSQKTPLDRLLETSPGLEIWWDSSPLVYSSWAAKLRSTLTQVDSLILEDQLRRLYHPADPANTLFTGVTTNPPLSFQAIQDDPARWSAWVEAYDRRHPGMDADLVAWELYKTIVRLGAEAYLPVFERSGYAYGHLSAQVNPYTFFDEEEMVAQALELHALSPNIAIKIPGTFEGVRAIKRLTSLGVPTNCTSGYTVPQFVAVAEAVQEGLLLAREQSVDLTGWRSVITFMSARWEAAPDFLEQAKQAGIELTPEDIRWAGVAIFKNAYRVFRQKAYPSKLLICSLRLGPKVDGVMRCWHVEETAGADVIFTLPPSFLTELFTQAGHLEFAPRIWEDIPGDVMTRLRKVPYFNAAYDAGGMQPEQFNQIQALQLTQKEFCGAMDKIVAFTAQAQESGRSVPADR
jgi:transaldolase